MRLTVGPLPPAVYWRRRALVLGAALVALFLVAQACMASAPAGDRASGEESSPPATLSPVASSSASAEPASPPPAEPADDEDEDEDEDEDGGPEPRDDGAGLGPDGCTDDEILVTAEASETAFAVGDEVEFVIRIAHDADRPCRRDVGGDHRELRLVRGSGAAHVWSSRDCANPTGEEVRQLTEGYESTYHIGFTGLDTSACDGVEAAGQELAPGEYQLRARLGTALSEPLTITLQ